MATSSLISKTHHVRSTSLPSTPHPLVSHCDELLNRFNASESASSCSTISSKLVMLKDLHDCVDGMIHLPENQRAISQDVNCVNGLLDRSLRLLDVCESAKDAVSQSKQSIHELQSSLRRRGCGEIGITKEATLYFTHRRIIKKTAKKSMTLLHDLETTTKNQENYSIASILAQIQAATLMVLESLLTLIAGLKGRSSSTGKWSLVSKLMQSKRVHGQKEESTANEFELVDTALKSLVNDKTNKAIPIEDAQALLGDLELNNQDLDEGLESLFRELIKTRVSLLNALNH